MSPQLGEYALSGAMLACVAVLFGVLSFIKTRNEGILRAIRAGVLLIAGLMSVSSWSLLTALLDDNFKLDYVLRHSEKSLALQYKIAAFWAGQEGSLLLWSLVLALMTLVMAFAGRRKNTAEQAVSLGIMVLVTGFFTMVMLFAGNPFDAAKQVAANGEGLNPMLQNLAMVLHPPMLFLGYAGFTAPFSLLLAALFTGSKDGQWLRAARPWMVYSWVVLTVGIVLGAWWAYEELSWGGYWAWDPVENASIFPWFTGTALLHSAVLQTNRGIFKRWVAFLVAASFFLCIFGTYLTRSGVVQSMHGFPESPISAYFLAALAVIGIGSTAVIVLRRNLLVAEHKLEDPFSREGFFLAANILLAIMTATLVVGTIFPVISGWFSKTPITVGAAFYNNVMLPVGLVLALLMATGPVLGSGLGAGLRAARKLAGIAIMGLLAAGAVFAMGYHSVWVTAAGLVIAAILTGFAIDIFTSFRPRSGQNIVAAIVKALAIRPRHWGAQLAHLGLAAIIAGVAGSSVYGNTQHVTLEPGASARVGSYTFTLKDFAESRRANHAAVVARVEVKDAAGNTLELAPERRFYEHGMGDGESASKTAIRYSLGNDLYLTLDGWGDNGKTVTIGVIINPLVSWIWIGGALLAIGGLVCLIPTKQHVHAPAVEAETPAVEDAHTLAARPAVAARRRSSRKRKHNQTIANGSNP